MYSSPPLISSSILKSLSRFWKESIAEIEAEKKEKWRGLIGIRDLYGGCKGNKAQAPPSRGGLIFGPDGSLGMKRRREAKKAGRNRRLEDI